MFNYSQLDEMFCQGCAFADCSDIIGSMPNSFYLEYSSAQIVNAAFSAEIFLKVLLKYLNINVDKIHKLSELFDQLPSSYQEAIQSYVVVRSGTWNERDLLLISNAFVDWRYGYEHEKTLQMPLHFLIAFRDALRKQCAITIFGSTWEKCESDRRQRLVRINKELYHG